jgi:Na+/proline symporter
MRLFFVSWESRSNRKPNCKSRPIRKVLLQVLGVRAYFVLVGILYWRGLTDVGAAAIIVGLLFQFKAVVHSRGISIAHLSASDPEPISDRPQLSLLRRCSVRFRFRPTS